MKKEQSYLLIVVTVVFIAVVTVMIVFRYHADFMPLLGESSDATHNNSVLSDGKININTATAETLSMLPGIGETLAIRIVEYRQQHGSFNTIEDLKNIKGISAKVLHRIEAYITVGS